MWKEILLQGMSWGPLTKQLYCGLISWPIKIRHLEGILFPQRSAHLISWPVKKVVKEYEMICAWFANRESLFPEKSFIKVDLFRVRWEKISDVHTKDRGIRKISPRTTASLPKASLSKKLRNIERLHQPDTSFVCLKHKKK